MFCDIQLVKTLYIFIRYWDNDLSAYFVILACNTAICYYNNIISWHQSLRLFWDSQENVGTIFPGNMSWANKVYGNYTTDDYR